MMKAACRETGCSIIRPQSRIDGNYRDLMKSEALASLFSFELQHSRARTTELPSLSMLVSAVTGRPEEFRSNE